MEQSSAVDPPASTERGSSVEAAYGKNTVKYRVPWQNLQNCTRTRVRTLPAAPILFDKNFYHGSVVPFPRTRSLSLSPLLQGPCTPFPSAFFRPFPSALKKTIIFFRIYGVTPYFRFFFEYFLFLKLQAFDLFWNY